MKSKILFITTGELFAGNNLVKSQVLKPAAMFQKKGFDVEYLCVEPTIKLIKNKLFKKKVNSQEQGVTFPIRFFRSILQTRTLYSYRHIDRLAKKVARKIAKVLQTEMILDEFPKIVFLCRSYLATSVALAIRDVFDDTHKDRIKVIFDTRSILSNEIPLTNGKKGIGLYGQLKQWEYELITKSDASLVVTKRGVEYFKLEMNEEHKVIHVPISGFAVDRKYKSNFDKKWQQPRLAFIGSIGTWHSDNYIVNMLDHFVQMTGFEAEIITNSNINANNRFPVYSVDNHEMINVYEKMLAIVVPGNPQNNYFEVQKMAINIFSTKAAEALSIGVPVIVNEQIRDLADFVTQHKCGIVYRTDYKNGKYDYINCSKSDFKKKKFWLTLHQNALKAGKCFQQENIVKRQIAIINKI